MKRITKQESFEQIGNDLENDFDGAKKLIYHMAKNYRKESQPPSYAIKDENGENLLTEPRDIELRWRNHFENLLNPPNQGVVEYEVNYQVDDSDEPDLTLDELNHALKKMKNGKAPGEDGIPAELLKNLGDARTTWFLKLCVSFWSGGENPDEWGLDYHVSNIQKRGQDNLLKLQRHLFDATRPKSLQEKVRG